MPSCELDQLRLVAPAVHRAGHEHGVAGPDQVVSRLPHLGNFHVQALGAHDVGDAVNDLAGVAMRAGVDDCDGHELLRRRSSQRRSSSAPHTTNGNGATKSNMPGVSPAVPRML